MGMDQELTCLQQVCDAVRHGRGCVATGVLFAAVRHQDWKSPLFEGAVESPWTSGLRRLPLIWLALYDDCRSRRLLARQRPVSIAEGWQETEQMGGLSGCGAPGLSDR